MPDIEVAILDVTRMREDRVCIAGIYRDRAGRLTEIRPVPVCGNIHRDFLMQDNEVIEPFTVVEFKFLSPVSNPPHVEDWVFEELEGGGVRIARKLSESEKLQILDSISRSTLADIYGPNLVCDKYIYECESGRSLGCLKIDKITNLYIDAFEDKPHIRLEFMLGNAWVSHPVVELRLHQHISELMAKGAKPADIRRILRERLEKSGPVYLRMGLSRPYRSEEDRDEDPRKKCYVQILGIHTFPDYLRG